MTMSLTVCKLDLTEVSSNHQPHNVKPTSILTDALALHFKLAVTNDDPAKDYDAAQYIYTPQLDSSRDRALIELLPDFLTTEIAFPRAQLAKFYIRVVRALNTDPPPADESDSEEDVSEEITVA